MKNLKISAKLTLCLAVLFLSLLGLGALSIIKMGGIGALAKDIATDRKDRLEAAYDLAVAVAQYRADQAAHIIAADDQTRAAVADDARAQRQVISERMDWLDAHVVNPQMRAAMATFKQQWAAYLPRATATFALSEQNLDEQAGAMFRNSKAAFDPVNAAAVTMQRTQSKLMTDMAGTAQSTFSSSREMIIGSLVLASIMVLAMLATLVRGIARPLTAMTGALSQLASGKLDAEVPVDARSDEIGELANAMKGLRDQLSAAERAKQEQTQLIVSSVGEGLEALAGGDLTVRIDTDLTGPFSRLKTNFNKAVESLQAAIGEVAGASAMIHTGASEVRQASDDLSQRTEQQAASLEETSAAMDEITGTVGKSAEHAGRANDAVREARREAETSGQVVSRAVAAMGGIERSSQEISEIIGVIDGIAFQTNLLALNAGVEAARAGDAGKGFAVVASEVRALAQRSAEAAKDVKERITASTEQVEAGVALVSETGQALERIIARINDVSSLISGIAVSAEQQASGLAQVNTAVGEMDNVTQQNAAMVEEATAAARSLASEADQLSRLVARFRTGDVGRAAANDATVHQLQRRAQTAKPRMPRAILSSRGNAAVAADLDDWSEF